MDWLEDLLDDFDKKKSEKNEQQKLRIQESLIKEKELRYFNEKIIREIIIPMLRESKLPLQKRNITCELKEDEITYAEDKGQFINEVRLNIKLTSLEIQPLFIKVTPVNAKKEIKIEYMANNRVGPKSNSISTDTLSKSIFEKMLKQIFSEMFPV